MITTKDSVMETQQNQTAGNNLSDLRLLTGVFPDSHSIERAYSTLLEKGYKKEDVTLIISDDGHSAHFSGDKSGTDMDDIAKADIGSSSAIGSTVGVVAGVAVALGAGLLIPGAGVLIAGPLALGLAGAGAGAVTGGVIGALVGSGVAEEHAKLFEHEIINGRIVMGVHPHNDADADFLERDWRENNAEIIFRQEMPD